MRAAVGRRVLLGVVACVLAASPLAAAADPASSDRASAFVIGVDDDHAKWLARPTG